MEGVMDSKEIEVLNVKKLKNVNVSRQSIYNFIKRNCMEKVGPGIYISKDVLEDEAYVLSQRCPKGVISHDVPYIIMVWLIENLLCIVLQFIVGIILLL